MVSRRAGKLVLLIPYLGEVRLRHQLELSFGDCEIIGLQDDAVIARGQLASEFETVDRVADSNFDSMREPGGLPAVGPDQQSVQFESRMRLDQLCENVRPLADLEFS